MDRSPTDMLLDAVGVIIGSEGHDYGVRQIAVLIPELVVKHWWHTPLHNQRSVSVLS